MASSHWVEELFPPAFGLTLNDILEDKSVLVDLDEKEHSDVEGRPKKPEQPSIFTKVAKKISPLDTAAIKNVYERVWLMEYLEQNKGKHDSAEFSLRSTPKGSMHLMPRKGAKQDAETSTTDINEHIDFQDPCLWTSKEIDVLRTVFKAASAQNIELKASLAATQQELDILKKKYKVQNKHLDARNESLSDARKANERLKILCDNFKLQSKQTEKKMQDLETECQGYIENARKYLKKIQELQKQADLERLRREELETKLELYSQEALREQILREENLKTQHEQDVKYLQTKITELEGEIKKEKKDHERTMKGLNHLRTHFASMPLAGEGASQNSVSTDQLRQWTYK